MRPEEGDQARLWDIIQWGDRLERLLAGVTWDAYVENEEKQIAVERCIEVIGEAARHLSPTFKERHHDLPWRAIVQQRNVIAHGYFFLQHDRLWRVAVEEVPRLVDLLRPLLDAMPGPGEASDAT